MPNVRSPEVIVIEKDISEYPANVDSSRIGIVGFADKGPTNEATLVTSQNQLIDKFGAPSEDIPGQGLEAALEVLGATNNVYYVRASDENNAVNASSTVKLGACPAMMVSGGTAGAYFGIHDDLYLKIQVYDNIGRATWVAPKKFPVTKGTIPSSIAGYSQGQALRKVIGGDLDANRVGGFYDANTTTSGFIVGSWAGSGASLGVSAYANSNYDTGIYCLKPLDALGEPSGTTSNHTEPDVFLFSSLRSYGVDFATAAGQATVGNPTMYNNTISYVAEALDSGKGYNLGVTPTNETSGVSTEITTVGGPNVTFSVNQDGSEVENFKVGLVSSNFIESKINIGRVDRTSDFIKGNLYFSGAADPSSGAVSSLSSFTSKIYDSDGNGIGIQSGVQGMWKTAANETGVLASVASAFGDFRSRFCKPIVSTYGMAGGTTTASSVADLIGSATGAKKTGMQALDDDVLNISIAMVPGISDQSVQNALVTLAKETQNFIALLAPPQGIGSAQDAIDWTNGTSQTRTAALNDSYAAVYWPWVQVYSVADRKDRWYDPSIFAARAMALTDDRAEPWFAPAGFIRGKLAKPTDVEVKLNKGDRDALYSGGNVVNPIVNFPQQGITIFGQRTTQRDPTALDRVNVRRLLIQLRKIILASTRRFLFEPNDEFLWDQIQNVVSPLLRDIQERRGLVEFRVVCDETTNTPVRVDRNELWCKVLLKPTKAAEVIVFELNVTNQSANLGNL